MSTLRRHLPILLALATILASGMAIGYRLGQRASAPAVESITDETASWESATLASLSRALQLTPEQQDAIRPQIAQAGDEIEAARREAMHRFRATLLDLIDRIEPLLEPQQQEQLQRDRAGLQLLVAGRVASTSAKDFAAAPPVQTP